MVLHGAHTGATYLRMLPLRLMLKEPANAAGAAAVRGQAQVRWRFWGEGGLALPS